MSLWLLPSDDQIMAMGNPLSREDCIGKPLINGPLSIAMFDYRRVLVMIYHPAVPSDSEPRVFKSPFSIPSLMGSPLELLRLSKPTHSFVGFQMIYHGPWCFVISFSGRTSWQKPSWFEPEGVYPQSMGVEELEQLFCFRFTWQSLIIDVHVKRGSEQKWGTIKAGSLRYVPLKSSGTMPGFFVPYLVSFESVFFLYDHNDINDDVFPLNVPGVHLFYPFLGLLYLLKNLKQSLLHVKNYWTQPAISRAHPKWGAVDHPSHWKNGGLFLLSTQTTWLVTDPSVS